MTLNELIDTLTDIRDSLTDGDCDVRLAIQPSWPFEHSIGRVALVENAEDTGTTVYIGEGGQLGYLSADARAELGWR